MQIKASTLLATDLKVGSLYVWVEVTSIGQMLARLFTLVKDLNKDGEFLITYHFAFGDQLLLVTPEHLGCSISGVPESTNYNRVFAGDEAIYEQLDQLARRSDIKIWLKHLGVENPDAVSLALAEKRQQADLELLMVNPPAQESFCVVPDNVPIWGGG